MTFSPGARQAGLSVHWYQSVAGSRIASSAIGQGQSACSVSNSRESSGRCGSHFVFELLNLLGWPASRISIPYSDMRGSQCGEPARSRHGNPAGMLFSDPRSPAVSSKCSPLTARGFTCTISNPRAPALEPEDFNRGTADFRSK